MRAAGPSWVHGHALRENVLQQALLLQKGEVVWAALLQANNALFNRIFEQYADGEQLAATWRVALESRAFRMTAGK
jgi:hypothetical protein